VESINQLRGGNKEIEPSDVHVGVVCIVQGASSIFSHRRLSRAYPSDTFPHFWQGLPAQFLRDHKTLLAQDDRTDPTFSHRGCGGGPAGRQPLPLPLPGPRQVIGLARGPWRGEGEQEEQEP
jgi:hypothetical protein